MAVQEESKRRRWNELLDATAPKELPIDIVIQIVSRVPIKSILCFKLVSKAWYALIISPEFARSYLRSASNKPCLLVQTHNQERSVKVSAIEFLCSTDFKPVVRDFVPPMATTTDSELLGSINGLVCLSLRSSDSSSFVLWNPATGKHFRIPNDGMYITRCFHKVSLGFAYDEETDCYKVIRLIRSMYRAGSDNITMEIYSSGTNTWRRHKLESFPSWYDLMSGCILRGSPYWFGIAFVTELVEVCKPFVMHFNPSTEKLTWNYVDLPLEDGEGDQFRRIGMGFEGESPVLFALKPQEVDGMGSVVKTWRLNKEMLRLEKSDVVVGLFLRTVLGIWRNGETIGLDEDGELVMYDYKVEDAAYLPYPPSDGLMEKANACEYIPSLLPPPYPST